MNKNEFYSSIHRCLKKSGLLLTYDLMPCNNPQHLQALRYLCMTQGLTELQCQKMLDRMENDFSLFHLVNISNGSKALVLKTYIHTVKS